MTLILARINIFVHQRDEGINLHFLTQFEEDAKMERRIKYQKDKERMKWHLQKIKPCFVNTKMSFSLQKYASNIFAWSILNSRNFPAILKLGGGVERKKGCNKEQKILCKCSVSTRNRESHFSFGQHIQKHSITEGVSQSFLPVVQLHLEKWSRLWNMQCMKNTERLEPLMLFDWRLLGGSKNWTWICLASLSWAWENYICVLIIDLCCKTVWRSVTWTWFEYIANFLFFPI